MGRRAARDVIPAAGGATETTLETSTQEATADEDDDRRPPTDNNDPSAPQPAARLQLQHFRYTTNAATDSPPSRLRPRPRPHPYPPPAGACTSTSARKRRGSTTTSAPPPTKAVRLSPTSAHPPLAEILAPDLFILFLGLNPGLTTAATGHHYAHPSNRFWPLLHTSGVTPDRRLRPAEARELLAQRYGCGSTNIVARASRNGGELGRSEVAAGTPRVEALCARWRPEVVCVVGKGIWEAVLRWRGQCGAKGKGKAAFAYGWQDEAENMGTGDGDGWRGSRVFVACSTSGISASLRPAEREAIWRPLGEWVQERRRERDGKRAREEVGNVDRRVGDGLVHMMSGAKGDEPTD